MGMIKFIGYILFTGLLYSCINMDNRIIFPAEEARRQMLEADRSFSNMSRDKGMKAAFIEYIDSAGVLLRPNQVPLLGGNAIDYLTNINDTAFHLTWEPKNGTIAKSGDLGFSYGVYKLVPSTKDTAIFGTYVSIWRKQANGSWKFVLDTGNEGLGTEDQEKPQ